MKVQIHISCRILNPITYDVCKQQFSCIVNFSKPKYQRGLITRDHDRIWWPITTLDVRIPFYSCLFTIDLQARSGLSIQHRVTCSKMDATSDAKSDSSAQLKTIGGSRVLQNGTTTITIIPIPVMNPLEDYTGMWRPKRRSLTKWLAGTPLSTWVQATWRLDLLDSRIHWQILIFNQVRSIRYDFRIHIRRGTEG